MSLFIKSLLQNLSAKMNDGMNDGKKYFSMKSLVDERFSVNSERGISGSKMVPEIKQASQQLLGLDCPRSAQTLYRELSRISRVLTNVEPGNEGGESFFSVIRDVHDTGVCFLKAGVEGFEEVFASIAESFLVDDEGLGSWTNIEGYELGSKNPRNTLAACP
jgi:hypothetical protein